MERVPLEDDITEMILVLLHRQGELETGEIANQLEIDHNNKIRYRLEEHLIPAGLTKRVGRCEKSGATKDAVVYEITEAGRSIVKQHKGELSDPAIQDDLIDLFLDLHEKIDEMDDRFSELESRIDRMDDTITNHSKRLTKWKGRVQDFEDEIEHIEKCLESHTDGLERHHNRLNDIEQEVDQLDDISDVNKENIQGLKRSIGEMADDIYNEDGKVGGQIHELSADLQTLEREVEELRQQLEEGHGMLGRFRSPD